MKKLALLGLIMAACSLQPKPVTTGNYPAEPKAHITSAAMQNAQDAIYRRNE